MIVAGDLVLRLAGHRAFEDSVVGRVFCDYSYAQRRLDMFGELRYLLERAFDLHLGPAELLTPKDALNLTQDGIGNC